MISWGHGVADLSHATVGGKWALRKGSDAPALPEIGEIQIGLQADAAVLHVAGARPN